MYGNIHSALSAFVSPVTVYGCSDTLRLLCATPIPMASGAGGGIPGNDLGQGFTSHSTFTDVLGVSGAPISVPSAMPLTRDRLR